MDFAHRHAAGIKGQDFFIKPAPTGLVLGDNLGLKAGVTVAGNFYGQLTKVVFESFLAFTVASVAGDVPNSVAGLSRWS